MSRPASMRKAVRPTRWAWASLWLTQIMARWALCGQPAVDQFFDGRRGWAIQGGRRLVEQQDRGIELQRPDQGRDLDFAAGKLGNLLFQEGRVASQGGKQVVRPAPIELPLSMNIQGIRLAQGGLHGILDQGRSLMEVDDRCPVVGNRIVVDGLAAVANFAPIERIQPGQCPQEAAFSPLPTGRSAQAAFPARSPG